MLDLLAVRWRRIGPSSALRGREESLASLQVHGTFASDGLLADTQGSASKSAYFPINCKKWVIAMFRSVLISHDGSLSVEKTLAWLKPLLGKTHSNVELFGRQDAADAGELNSQAHLEELARELKAIGSDVVVLPHDYDLTRTTPGTLIVVHDPELAVRLLRESDANVFFTPDGVSPHVPKRVLVPLDGSEYSKEILPLLVPLAKSFNPLIELLRVAPDEVIEGQGSLMVGTAEVATRASVLESLKSSEEFLEKEGLNVISHLTRTGKLHRRILETAITDMADLIAVSTHGHGRLARWLFGSCTENLIEAGTTPLLVRNTRAS